MKGVIWLLWLTVVIGTCYCSFGNNVTTKYCGSTKLGQHCESKNASLHLYVSLAPLAGVGSAPPSYENSPSPSPPARKRQKLNPNAFDPALHTNPDIQDVVNGADRFLVKHVYMDGKLGDKVNSFDELTGNPEKIRRYLIEVNRRMFKGQVLPETISSTQTFDKWMQGARTNPRKVSLIDGNLELLRQDIISQPDFKTYLAEVQSGKRTPLSGNLFTTKSEYLITEITLQADFNNNLEVKIERFKAKLEIGMENEKVYHYHQSQQSVINANSVGGVNFVDVETKAAILQTKFTEGQLRANEKATLEFWQDLFAVQDVEEVRFNKALNEEAERYKKSAKKFANQWEDVISPPDGSHKQAAMIKSLPGACVPGGAGRRRKRARNGCVFYVDSEGEIESIHPEEFMEVFELEQEEGRGRMVSQLKKNGDKYIVNDDQNWLAARRRLNQLVHHDEMTIHAEIVETTGTIQDLERWKRPVPKTPSQLVAAISEAVSARMNRVKLSATKVVHNLAANRYVTGISKGQKPYGYLMMSKGLIVGIIHNDTTAMAVMGSRLGYDIVTDVGTKVGTKFFSTATKIGRGARVLGKVAGPIGSIVDVGLGAWSLSKSVKRLKEASNEYDRDDAIAEVVSESIDIAVGTTALVLSVAFPPAAPLIFAVAFIINILNSLATALFKAGNEVKRINSEIPLSGAEKAEVYTSRFFDWFGLREKDYLEYLVEEKRANDLAVKSYLEFLRSTNQFMGVLFPSRSLSMDGGCQLKVYFCPNGSFLGRDLCSSSKTWTNCSWNSPCAYGKSCVNDRTLTSIYDCTCDDNKAWANFGGSHTDSDVDFREKRQVYWERSVPGDVSGAEFKCKPSYLEYTDHRTQQSDSRNEYHCFHAIGVYLPQNERKKGQSFLVNLEDGKDTVLTDQKVDDTPYTFWLGEKGQKSFWGGKNKNEFILNGNCSEGLLNGNLYGGPEATDSLIIGPSCAKGQVVELSSTAKLGGNTLKVILSSKLNLVMERIENIIGRPKDAEKVQVVCNTRKLFLNGGASSKSPDIITVDPLLCPLDLATVLGNYTDFSSRALNGEITVYVGQDMEGSSINVVRPRLTGYKDPKTTIIFTEITAEVIDIEQSSLEKKESSLKFWDSSSHARAPLTINYETEHNVKGNEQHQIFFNESSVHAPNTYSVLVIPANEQSAKTNGPLYFFHSLSEIKASMENPVTRMGNQNLPNLFNISGRDWVVQGGKKDDTFFLNADISRVAIDGKGGQNTLLVQSFQSSLIELNGNDKLKGIQTVVKGDKIGSSLEVSTGCDTKAVVTKGDDWRAPDTVTIHKCIGGTRELQIDAAGRTTVVVDGDLIGENEMVRVVAHRTTNAPVQFKLETGNFEASNMFVQVELGSFDPETFQLEKLNINRDGKSFQAFLQRGGVASLDLHLGIPENDNGFYLATPQIQLLPKEGYPSQLVFQRATLEPMAVHVIKEDRHLTRIVGFKRMQNLFQIQSPRWTIEGGEVKDMFIGGPLDLAKSTLKPNEHSDNTLIVNHDEANNFGKGKPFHVNLEDGEMGGKDETDKWINGKIIGGKIQHVIGRPNQADVIITGCAVKSVAGRGGIDAEYPDLIVIKDNDNCGEWSQSQQDDEMEVHLGQYTKVENSAQNRFFRYFVDLEEPLANQPFTITTTATNHHKIIFQDEERQSRLEFIKFDQQQQKLSFHTRLGGNSAAIEFPMYRSDEQSDYVNPKFLVTSKDNWISRDVRVDSEGSVVSTALLDSDCVDKLRRNAIGLPVDTNIFLINITSRPDSHDECDTSIEAGATSRSNQFWLYGVADDNQLTIGTTNDFDSSSSVHLGQDFVGDKSIVANLSLENGYLSIPGKPEVILRSIYKFVGRSSSVSYDTVIPSCYTKQISGVDLIYIKIDPSMDCSYNLIIGMERGTHVNFEWNGYPGIGRTNLTRFWSSTFHYRFSEPMSFELGQSYPGLLDDTEHILYLPFNLDEMETLIFVEEENKLYYTIDSKKYSVSMVSKPGYEDQFYSQPSMVTQDGLRLLVGRDASLLISGQLEGSNGTTGQELLQKYQDVANNLGVTMVIKTDAGLLHVGHDGDAGASDRNVVQNVAYSESYLGGGGALNTIYEVVSLDKNVYIATGLNDEGLVSSSVNLDEPYSAMQTLDLTDIVSPIRYATSKKYKPAITRVGDDLVISMEGHMDTFPGKIVVYGGVSPIVRQKLQVLLSHSMMNIVPPDVATGNTWQLAPIPVHLKRETVYSLAAQDLEYDHHISILDHVYGPEYHFRFSYSRNGDDLHLSDIEEFREHRYDERHIEMTTVIITDFYKKLNEQMEVDGDAPAEIVNVILDLPGLKIKLDGTDVFLLSNQNEEDTEMSFSPTVSGSTIFTPPMATQNSSSSLPTATFQAPVLLSPKSISEWSHILHEVEEKILEELPFVHRNY